MSRNIGQDVEHAANTVVEALVRRMFEVHERLKQKESEFINIHNTTIYEMERNILKQYESHRFSIEGEKGLFEMKGFQNDKVIFGNDEKSVQIDLNKLDSLVKSEKGIDKETGIRNIDREGIHHEGAKIDLKKEENDLHKAKELNTKVTEKLEKGIDNSIQDNKSLTLIPSQIRGQLEVLNHLKNMSEKEVLKSFKNAQKQAKIEDKPIVEIYKENLQKQVSERIRVSKEITLDTAINTYEKNQELRKDLRSIDAEINKNMGVLYQAKLEQKISPEEYKTIKENLETQKEQINDRILKINQSDQKINEQLKVDLQQQFPDMKTDKLTLNESIGLAKASYSMTNEKTIENLRNFSLENDLKGIINSIDKTTKEVEVEIKEITEVKFSR